MQLCNTCVWTCLSSPFLRGRAVQDHRPIHPQEAARLEQFDDPMTAPYLILRESKGLTARLIENRHMVRGDQYTEITLSRSSRDNQEPESEI